MRFVSFRSIGFVALSGVLCGVLVALPDRGAAQNSAVVEVAPSVTDTGQRASDGTGYRSLVLGDGAASFWRLNESSGTVAADTAGARAGQYQVGALLGQVSGVDDSLGFSVQAPLGSAVVAPAAGLPVGNSAVSLEAWMKTTGDVADWDVVNLGGLKIRTQDGGARFYGILPSGTLFRSESNQIVEDTNWHHVVLTFSGTVLRLYTDGVLGAQVTVAVNSLPSTSILLGESGQFVDEVAVYPTALSATQVANHFRVGATGVATCEATTQATVYGQRVATDLASSLWHLDEGARFAADSFGSCRTGARSSAALQVGSGAIGANASISATDGQAMVAASGAGLPSGNAVRSLEAWIKTSGVAVSDWTPLDVGGVKIRTMSNGDRFYGVVPGAPIVRSENTQVIQDTNWHHVVLTFDGSTVRVYTDGALGGVQTGVTLTTPVDSAVFIGSPGSGQFVDEVAVYPVVLAAAQVANHFRVGATGVATCGASAQTTPYGVKVTADLALSFWHLDDTGRVATDSRAACRVGARSSTSVKVAGGAIAGSGSISGTDVQSMVAASGAGLPSGNSSRSIEAWIKTSGAVGDWTPVEIGGVQLRTMSNGDRFYGVVPGAPIVRSENHQVIQDTKWHHVVLTFDGTAVRVYTDGAFGGIQTGVTLATPVNAPVFIGQGVGQFVDEVAVYGGVLSATQIGEHFRIGATGVATCVAEAPASPYAQSVATDGAVSYWHLGESGRFAADVRGCRTGARSSSSGLASGVLTGDGAVTVGDSQSMVSASGALVPSGNSARTFEAWMRTPVGAFDWTVLDVGGLRIRTMAGGSRFYAVLPSGSNYLSQTNVSVQDAKWHHLVLTFDGANMNLYTDGVQGGGPIPVTLATPANAPVIIGQGPGDVVDEVAIYPSALTATQVAAHFAAGTESQKLINKRTVQGGGAKVTAGVVEPTRFQTVVDPVNTATGAFSHPLVDLVVPGKGEAFSFERVYDSTAANDGLIGVFGPGWGWNFGESIAGATDSATWNSGTGQQIVFANSGATYVSPPSVIAQLVAVSGGGWSLVRDDQVASTFDASGRLVSRKDRSGQGLSLAYAANGKLSTVTDAAGRIVTLTYGTAGAATGLLTQVKTADLRTVSFGYALVAGANRLTSVTDPRLKVSTLIYTTGAPVGLLASEVDPLGHAQFVNVYDGSGRVVDQADPTGAHSTFVWNDITGEMTMTDASGAVTKHQYVSYGFAGAVTPAGTTSLTRDARLFPATFTDALNKVWSATYDDRGNMLTRTSPLLFTESWTYDSFNNPLTHVDARGNTTTMTYDSFGRVLTEARPLGVNLAWSWNADGTLASSTDPRGGVTVYSYDANGLILSQTTPMGFKTTYAYDNAGRVLTVTEPRGNVAGATAANFQQKFTYDANGNVLTVKDALNRTTTNVYDNAGNMSKSTAPDGGVTMYSYNNANELVAMTAPDLGVTSYEYDNRGLQTKQTSPIGAITTFFYDSSGRLDHRVDPRGNEVGGSPAAFTTTFTYDAESRTKTVTDPVGRVTTYSYDDQGRQLSGTRPDGTTSMVYDQNGNVLSTTTEAGTTSSSFDALNRPTALTDARGKVALFEYDLAGNQVQVVDPLARKTTYTYDPDGRRTSVVEPRGYLPGALSTDFDTLFTYDAAGNQLTVTDPANRVVSTTYDRVGNQATMVKMNGQTTTYTYDSVNRVSKVTAPVVGATSYTYSTMGYLKTRTNPLLKVTSWDYDLAGRRIKETDPLLRFFTYGYDVAGNQTSIVDANANAASNPALGSTAFSYDSLDRLVQRSYSDGTPTVSYTYDVQGRRDSMTDGTGTTVYGFDVADRVAAVSRGADTFAYVYDGSGNVVSRVFPDGSVVGGVFDDANQLVSVTDSGGTVSFAYDVAGNPVLSSFPNGVSRSVVFDSTSRVTEVLNSSGAGVLSKFNYTRDSNGNPIAVDFANGGGLSVTESQRLTYDAADRLTKVCYTTTACTVANATTWVYDKNGNRVSEKVGSAPASTYSYDATDQLTGIAGPGAVTFTYSANGDQLSAGTDTFAYNAARQTKGSTVAGVVRSFSYDGNGDRSATSTAGVVTSVALWDTVGGLANLVIERDGSNAVQRRYTYGRGTETLRYQDLVAGTTGWYQSDALGSVANITNGVGVASASYTYTPYGVARVNTVAPGFGANPLKFTGQYLDPAGTYYLRARQYNPAHGRFTQTDPLDRAPGSVWMTPYSYAANNPLVFVDPSGRRELKFASGDLSVIVKNPIVEPLSRREQCERNYANFVQKNDPLTVGFTSLFRSGSGGSCEKFSQNAAKLNALGLAVTPDYLVGSVSGSSGAWSGSANIYLTRYDQVWVGIEGSRGWSGYKPQHAKWRPTAAVRMGFINRSVYPSDAVIDSDSIDRTVGGGSVGASVSIPTPSPVNISIGGSGSDWSITGAAFELGIGSPTGAGFDMVGGLSILKLPGRPVRRLW